MTHQVPRDNRKEPPMFDRDEFDRQFRRTERTIERSTWVITGIVALVLLAVVALLVTGIVVLLRVTS